MVEGFEASDVQDISLVSAKAVHRVKSKPLRVTNMGHLKDVGMGYFEHMTGAFKLAFRFLLGTVQLIIHGFLPSLFVDAGKNASDAYKQ